MQFTAHQLTAAQLATMAQLAAQGTAFSRVLVHPYSGVATLDIAYNAQGHVAYRTVAMVAPTGEVTYRPEVA